MFARRNALVLALLQTAKEAGELRSDAEPEVVFDQLAGALYYRLLVTGQPIDTAYVHRLVTSALTGAAPSTRGAGETMTHAQLPTRVAETETPSASPRRRRRLLAVLSGLLAVLAGYTLWTNIRPVTLTASTEIDATPDQVWRVLTDFATYPRWNPFMTSAQVTSSGGVLAKGARMRIHLHDAGGDMTFTPEVLTARPGRELRWLGKAGPGWIADGEHRFRIEQLGPHRVRLTQSERFTGVAVPFIEGQLKSNTLPQFSAMNKALAQRATG